jgi:hypothetical protein
MLSTSLTAGVEMKVVSEMLRHKTLAIRADTYTSVVPEVARAAAEAAATIVPRRIKPKGAGGAASTSLAQGRKKASGRSSNRKKGQFRTGAPPGTRTSKPAVKSLLLRNSIPAIYQHVYASTLAR